MNQAERARRLLELHHAAEPLVLINAWDAASAGIVEQAGFPAIATTSAGVANALGYADGQHVPWPEMVDAIKRIARVVKVPVTADIEAGFSSDVQQLERSIQDVITAGAVGVNLEDAVPGHGEYGPLYSLADQTARIQSARKAGEQHGVHVVINARTDAYWQQGVTPEEALRNTLERGKAYLKAGADCIFIPGLKNPEHIRTVVQEFKSPVNILAVTGTPSIPELKALGVKRISMGSGPMRAVLGLLRRIIQEAQSSGTYKLLVEGAVSYAEMNALFE
jgi:2-methylisocitrate lyase-like PEP mutase family enzyme